MKFHSVQNISGVLQQNRVRHSPKQLEMETCLKTKKTTEKKQTLNGSYRLAPRNPILWKPKDAKLI